MFELGPLCDDSPHLAVNSIFDNLESLKPWAKKRFEQLNVVGAVETPLCRIFELSHPNINYFAFCKAE
jgi:hypothetical protein